MSEGTCRERVDATGVSTLELCFSPHNICGMVALLTTTITDASDIEEPPTPHRSRLRVWCVSAEYTAYFKIACTAREAAFEHLRSRPRYSNAWKTLWTTRESRQETIDVGVHAAVGSMARKQGPSSSSATTM